MGSSGAFGRFPRVGRWGWWGAGLLVVGVLLLVLQRPGGAIAPSLDGRVTAVHSGQSLEVLLAGSTYTQSVRLAGIEAPDRQQAPWSAGAIAHLQNRLLGQSIRLELAADTLDAATDSYDRIWGYVWQGDALINADLLAAGWAVLQDPRGAIALPHTPYLTRFAHAQEAARLLGAGIWASANPMRQSPRQFRVNLQEAPAGGV